MSPELFKCFIYELSEALNNLEDINFPTFNGTRVTHLLWADDLVLLALDANSLQKMLDVLHSYCHNWGLTVNNEKIVVISFNRSGRLLKDSKGPLLKDSCMVIYLSHRYYTYL